MNYNIITKNIKIKSIPSNSPTHTQKIKSIKIPFLYLIFFKIMGLKKE